MLPGCPSVIHCIGSQLHVPARPTPIDVLEPIGHSSLTNEDLAAAPIEPLSVINAVAGCRLSMLRNTPYSAIKAIASCQFVLAEVWEEQGCGGHFLVPDTTTLLPLEFPFASPALLLPGIQRALKSKAFIERAFVYIAGAMGVWWRFTRFQRSIGVGVCHGDFVS